MDFATVAGVLPLQCGGYRSPRNDMPLSVKKPKDPFAKREAAKYENPIPSREFILAQLKERAVPVTLESIAAALGLLEEDQHEALRRRLNAMRRDGQLMQNRRGAYGLIDKMNLLRGRIQGMKDGYGFFIPDGTGEDLYISSRQMYTVFDGDRVLVRPSEFGRNERKEGVIVEVIERAHQALVGRFFRENGVGFVVPENPRITQDILVAEDSPCKARQGQMVTVEISVYPSKRTNAVGRVVEVLGEHMAPGMEIDVALRTHAIPFEWPPEVAQSLKAMNTQIKPKDLAQRVDLRQLPFVTIDGEDARDFDDAVFCKADRQGWQLYVAIADVSHYVVLGSALDQEAHQRGTSVYFPERVIPMLPELLSNDLCSLNPKVDRLVMVCQLSINRNGAVRDYRFMEGVIHSQARLTYTKVSQMLEHPETKAGQKLRQEYAAVVPHLEQLYKLYLNLRSAREQRGAIDFESVETRIIFGAERKIDRIVPVVRNEAHKLIEECMLCANVAAADFLQTHQLPGLYRIHETPSMEKLAKLREFISELGLSLGGGEKPHAKDYQKLVAQIAGRADAHLIQTVMLRSMMQAVYSPDNLGHFGLAYEAYAHFTSPIRRYPDLLVHRAIRSIIRSRRASAKVQRVEGVGALQKNRIYPYDHEAMLQLGEHCSHTERRADDAVRDVLLWLKCEYMLDHVGDTFSGVISGVTAFGLFVELKDIYVEGLVHVSALNNDYYHFDAGKHRLVGERTHFSYALGDKIDIRVVRVDLDERKIDFELFAQGVAPSKKRGTKKPKFKNEAKTNKKPVKGKASKTTQAKPSNNRPGKKKPAKGKSSKRSARK